MNSVNRMHVHNVCGVHGVYAVYGLSEGRVGGSIVSTAFRRGPRWQADLRACNSQTSTRHKSERESWVLPHPYLREGSPRASPT